MHALILCGALCFASGDGDKLIQQLNADFDELLKKERDPQPMREAARLLDETNQSDHWMSYGAALAIIRRTRSKAAIPLLLKYMALHAGYSTGHVVEPAYADALTILTGKDVASPYQFVAERTQPVRDAVQKLNDEWWQPNKEKITTDLTLMSKDQIRVIVHRMLGQVERTQREYGSDSTETLLRQVAEAMQSDKLDRQPWQSEETREAMLPVLLELAGFDANPPANGPVQDDAHVLFPAVPMLAALRANGQAPLMDKIAVDERQSSATRLTCLLALYRAGEKLNAAQVVAILRREKKLDRRLTAILALKYSADARTVAGPLVDLLDDPNRSIQTAAIVALEGSAPKSALPKLRKVLDDLEPPQAVYAAIRTIGLMEGNESRTALADFMEAAQNDPKKGKFMYQALKAFADATGTDWIEAGAHSERYYRDKAKLAVEWWKTQK